MANTRTQTKEAAAKAVKGKPTGVPRTSDAKKQQAATAKALETANEAHARADEEGKKQIESQVSWVQPAQQPEQMQVDEQGEKGVKLEAETSTMRAPDRRGSQSAATETAATPSEQRQQSAEEETSSASEQQRSQAEAEAPAKPFEQRSQSAGAEASLFVENDPEDVIRASPPRQDTDGEVNHEGFMRGCFGRKHDINRIGPRNVAKFRLRRRVSEQDDEECLDDMSHGAKTHKGNKVAICGDIVALQGVAWSPFKGCDLYASLNPEEWKARKGRRPEMRIKVKWSPLVEGGETFVTWEKRDAIVRCWEEEDGNGRTIVKVDEECKIGNIVILTEGMSITRAAYAIINTAIRCEKRYKEWQAKERQGTERSPTPGLPLLHEKTTQQENNDSAG